MFWAYNAGRDPLKMLDELADRIILVHLKDGLAAKRFSGPKSKILGQGGAGIADIVAKLKDRNVRMIVESEGAQSGCMNDVRACIDYLKSLD